MNKPSNTINSPSSSVARSARNFLAGLFLASAALTGCECGGVPQIPKVEDVKKEGTDKQNICKPIVRGDLVGEMTGDVHCDQSLILDENKCPDVPKKDLCNWAKLIREKIISKFYDGTCKPKETVNRANLVHAYINRYTQEKRSHIPSFHTNYTDLQEGYWARSAILSAEQLGLIPKGKPKDKFDPNRNATDCDLIDISDRYKKLK